LNRNTHSPLQYIMEDLKETLVNSVARKIGVATITSGIKMVRSAIDDTPNKIDTMKIAQAFVNVGLGDLPMTTLDNDYETITWDEWQPVLDTIKSIASYFPWTAEYFDCDNRANFVKSFADKFTDVNTCGLAYLQIYHATTGAKLFLHYCNIILTTDGKLHLFDVDNNGGTITEIVKGQKIVGGIWRYEVLSTRWF